MATRLEGARTLLVLDNCEHVLTGLAALMRRLLRAAPALHVIATSRERVGMLDETVVRVEPMALGDAAELFAERLASSQSPTHQWSQIERICRKLDCLPLALELGAAPSCTG